MRRPFDQPGGDGARLRNQGERAGGRHPAGEAGIEMRARHDQAEAVRSEHAQAVGAGGGAHRLRKRAGAMAKAGADDDGRSHPPGSGGGDDSRHLRSRGCDHQHVGRLGDGIDTCHRLHPVDLRMAWIDEMNGTRETTPAQVAQSNLAERALARTGADDGDRFGRQQGFETIRAHRSRCPFYAVLLRKPRKDFEQYAIIFDG